MESTPESALAAVGVDAVAVKPAETSLDRVRELDADLVAVDYEGREHVPDYDELAALARDRSVRLTTPVRADGFDPAGDDSLLAAVPDAVGRVAVAGHPAYLDDDERGRAVAPRLRAAVERASDPWVGTESVERVALALGGTQYELLGPTTERDARALRAAGVDERIAVYAPLALGSDEDAVLVAVGGDAARREPVRRSLPADAPTDSSIDGPERRRLLAACRDYALVGDPGTVGKRVAALHDAGVDRVVAYPARGLAAVQ